jgi:hypothetical protein
MGYLASDKDDPNRLRKTLIGGATGAALGGLTGGLVASGASSGMPQSAVDQMKSEAKMDGMIAGSMATEARIASDPDVAVRVLSQMDPELREKVVGAFRKPGWLARMFGG